MSVFRIINHSEDERSHLDLAEGGRLVEGCGTDYALEHQWRMRRVKYDLSRNWQYGPIDNGMLPMYESDIGILDERNFRAITNNLAISDYGLDRKLKHHLVKNVIL